MGQYGIAMAKDKETQDKTEEGLLHLGADLPADLVVKFRNLCRERRFSQIVVLERLIEDWNSRDELSQADFIHRRTALEASFEARVAEIVRRIQALPEGHRARNPKVGT